MATMYTHGYNARDMNERKARKGLYLLQTYNPAKNVHNTNNSCGTYVGSSKGLLNPSKEWLFLLMECLFTTELITKNESLTTA